MANLTLTYEGKDVVFSREQIEAQGIQPGTELELRPRVELTPREWAPGEWEKVKAALDQLSGIWTDEDAERYYKHREEMWASWKPRDWS